MICVLSHVLRLLLPTDGEVSLGILRMETECHFNPAPSSHFVLEAFAMVYITKC
jgi:hypothetical protein